MQMKSLMVSALLLASSAMNADPDHRTGLLGKTRLRLRSRRLHASGPQDDLQSGSDKLAGSLDAVNTRFAEVRIAANNIDAECRTSVTNSLGRVQQQEQATTALETSQISSAANVGRLNAEIAQLLQREEATKESYDRSVSQRAYETQAFVNLQATLLDQQNVVSTVLQMLRDQRTLISGMPSGGSLSGSTSGSSSGMDEIVGIFSNMHDEVVTELQEEEEKHTKSDADLLALVNGYKVTLQHTDTQIEESQGQQTEAHLAGDNAAEEIRLHKSFTDAEDAVRLVQEKICGTSPGAHLQPSEHALASLQHQASQALSLMDELIASANTTVGNATAELLQSTPIQQSPLRRLDQANAAAWRQAAMANTLAIRKPPAARIKASPVTSATPAAALDVKVGQWSPFEANLVNSLNGMPQVSLWKGRANYDTRLKELTRLLHNSEVKEARKGFLALFRALQDTSKDEQRNTTLSEQADHCVREKQRLTAEIQNARQQARLARESYQTNQLIATVSANWEMLVQDEISALQTARDSAATSWSSLTTIAQSGSYTQTLQDALAEVDSIESDVQAYLASGVAPPRAHSLVITLGSIRASIQSILDNTITSGEFYDRYGELTLAYGTEISALQTVESQCSSDHQAATSAASSAQASVAQHEQSESNLMNQRTALEQQCEAMTSSTASTTPSPTTLQPSSLSTCTDTDNGATDIYGTTCADYSANPDYCAYPGDGPGFSGAEMCCACGGGQQR